MAEQDYLVEVIETTQITVETPVEFTITLEDRLAENVIELEVVSVPVTVDGAGPPTMRLELLDGDLFVATNDGLMGTRLRQITNTLVAPATTFSIPQTATRLFGFSLNGIDYLENATLELGSGSVTFVPGTDGYAPRAGDFLVVTSSE